MRLDAGFTIDAEGRLADGTPYKLIYRLEKIVGQEALLVLKRRERSRKLRGRCRDISHEQEDYPEPLYCVRNEVRDLVFAQTAALISSALVTSEVKIV